MNGISPLNGNLLGNHFWTKKNEDRGIRKNEPAGSNTISSRPARCRTAVAPSLPLLRWTSWLWWSTYWLRGPTRTGGQFHTAGFSPVFFWHSDFRNDGCHDVLNDGLMMFNGEIGAIGGHTHYYIPWLRVVLIVLVKSRCSRFVAKS